jgi:hypothetical protein
MIEKKVAHHLNKPLLEKSRNIQNMKLNQRIKVYTSKVEISVYCPNVFT